MNLRLTVLILMLHAVAVPDAAHAAAETVNDARIEQELCGKGAALLKQNRLTPSATWSPSSRAGSVR
jgi:hypothetical protein